jgi:hypothetical protein
MHIYIVIRRDVTRPVFLGGEKCNWDPWSAGTLKMYNILQVLGCLYTKYIYKSFKQIILF